MYSCVVIFTAQVYEFFTLDFLDVLFFTFM